MRPFRFRLEKLLTIRHHETRRAQNALAIARLKRRQAAAYLEQVRAERKASAAALMARRQRRMTALEWRRTAEEHEVLVRKERVAEAILREAQAEEERRRRELTEAERREKSLELLKERRLEEYRLEFLAWEQAQTDEVAQVVFRQGGGLR